VQGFGNVGGSAVRHFHQRGACVVAVSDVQGGCYHPKGLDIPALIAHMSRTGSVIGFPEAEPVDNASLLELPCDILVPSALQGQITRANADKIQARMVVEGANGPTTPDADLILQGRGIQLVPDVLANAGGVTVSYFEWVQDLQSFFWTEQEVNLRLAQILSRAALETWDAAERLGTDLRTAAYAVGVRRVADAIHLRGIYP
jgi:glutamate dehydrogenase (NAD(P)+)